MFLWKIIKLIIEVVSKIEKPKINYCGDLENREQYVINIWVPSKIQKCTIKIFRYPRKYQKNDYVCANHYLWLIKTNHNCHKTYNWHKTSTINSNANTLDIETITIHEN